MRTTYRVLAIVLLLAVAGGLCVQYAATDRWSYPDADAIADDPRAHDGEQVLLFGEVLAVDAERGEILIDVDGTEFTVEGASAETIDGLEPDGSIQVYGAFQADSGGVTADEIVVDFRSTTDRIYVYTTSILGGLLAAGYFLWHWRIDWRNLRFRLRRAD